MASFWGTLGDIAGGVLDVLDPTPGNIASSVITRTAGSILPGGGGGGSPNGGVRMIPAVGGNGVYSPPRSDLGPYLEYLVPDPIERAIGTMPSNGSCAPGPVVVQPQVSQRLKAPSGYRIVECPKGSGQKVAMREETARKYGYLSPRRRPPISVRDWTSLKRADRTVRKLDRVVQMSNRVVGKRKYRRSAPSTSVSCRATARTRKR